MTENKNTIFLYGFLILLSIYFYGEIISKLLEFILGNSILPYVNVPFIHLVVILAEVIFIFYFLKRVNENIISKRRMLFISIACLLSLVIFYFVKDYHYSPGICGTSLFDGTYKEMAEAIERNAFIAKASEYVLVFLTISFFSIKKLIERNEVSQNP